MSEALAILVVLILFAALVALPEVAWLGYQWLANRAARER